MRPSITDVVAAAVRRLPHTPREGIERRLFSGTLRSAAELVPHLPPTSRAHLLIGPMNTAGQAFRWARAAEAHLPRVAARSVTLERPGGVDAFRFPTDIDLPLALRPGRAAWREEVFARFSHVMFESGYSPTSMMTATADEAELDRYREAGVMPAVVFHGSDIRDPYKHAELYPASPFRTHKELAAELSERIRPAQRMVTEAGLPFFVSTPDLLDFVPGARLLPVVVDVERFAAPRARPALERERPVVLHAPSNAALKGTPVIEPVLQQLHEAGRITYRRLQGVPNDQMPAFIADADVVVDQILLGAVGVLAAEAMAAGRLVIGHVHGRVRAHLQDGFPVVDARPDTLPEVMDAILDARQHYAEVAAAGPAWSRAHHSGRTSAEALATHLMSNLSQPPGTHP